MGQYVVDLLRTTDTDTTTDAHLSSYVTYELDNVLDITNCDTN